MPAGRILDEPPVRKLERNMVGIIETRGERPICPHCETELRTLKAEKIKSSLGVRFVYFCAHCRKVLGVSHRKGF